MDRIASTNRSHSCFDSDSVGSIIIAPGTISGNAVGTLYPGALAIPVVLTLGNPNNIPIYVTSLTIAASNASCSPAANVALVQVNLSTATPTAGQIAIPANGSVTLPADGVAAPTIRMVDTHVNQTPACAGQTFSLSYSGSAHS